MIMEKGMNIPSHRKLNPLICEDIRKHSITEYLDIGSMIYGLACMAGVVWKINLSRKSIGSITIIAVIIVPASPSAAIPIIIPYKRR
jgi:hypothetical protein